MKLKNKMIAFTFVCFSLSCTQLIDKKEPKNSAIDTAGIMNVYVKSDQSEMDMSWCPTDYPMEHMQGNATHKLIARVIYSRPHKKGRQIFGNTNESLCMYGKPWRLGANEATELTLFENVTIAGTAIDKGSYVLYCIPQADKWTLILNSNLYTWGLHIDQTKDVFKTDIPVTKQGAKVENFTLFFSDTPTGADMTMAWDDVKTILPIQFDK